MDTVSTHITITPGVAGGKPRITGCRITVQDIMFWHERLGISADEIATEYDLTLAGVYAALDYYYDHREEIDRSLRMTSSSPRCESARPRCYERDSLAEAMRFYLDEHVPHALAKGLRYRGADAITSQEVGLLGAEDPQQLAFAQQRGRVFVTHDADFLRLDALGHVHAGIVYGPRRTSIGAIVASLPPPTSPICKLGKSSAPRSESRRSPRSWRIGPTE